jgi:hypothetical protein
MGENKNYRWIWIKHNGPIPKDENGQTFEIHHIDRDRTNNSIENLQCVSKREHAQIHFDANEFAAAYAILKRTKGILRDFSGWKHTEKTKTKISESLKGEKNPMYGRKRDDRQNKGYWRGKKQPLEMVKKRVEKNKGQKRPNQSEKMMGLLIGEKNGMFGIKGKEHHRSKPVKDLSTGEVYDSIIECCENKGYTKQTFYYHLKKNRFCYIK